MSSLTPDSIAAIAFFSLCGLALILFFGFWAIEQWFSHQQRMAEIAKRLDANPPEQSDE